MIHKILPRASGWVLILLCQVGLASSLNSCGASEISLNLFELEINDFFVTGLKGLTRESKHTCESTLGPWQTSLIDYCTHCSRNYLNFNTPLITESRW